MKQIIVFPRGQLTDSDRKLIAKAGAVAVEADDPAKVVTVIPLAHHVTDSDLLSALLEALADSRSDHVSHAAMQALVRKRRPASPKGANDE